MSPLLRVFAGFVLNRLATSIRDGPTLRTRYGKLISEVGPQGCILLRWPSGEQH